jgi:hypothetical protein
MPKIKMTKFSNLKENFKYLKKNSYYQEVQIHLALLNEDLDCYVHHLHLYIKN